MKKFLLIALSLLLLCSAALADEPYWDGTGYEFDFENEDYDGEIILDDPAYFLDLEEDEPAEPWIATPTDVEDTPPTVTPAVTPAADPADSPTDAPAPKRRREPTLHDIPQALLDADPAFAALMAEANQFVGYPYVWGGSTPETSFDCSGFVSYVFTNSGVYDVGRKGATGLYNLCTEVHEKEVRPGDLVFFQGTMGPEVPGITHVGIYVGDHWMIHCGDPVGYADLTETRWVKWFHSYGRLPIQGDDMYDQ